MRARSRFLTQLVDTTKRRWWFVVRRLTPAGTIRMSSLVIRRAAPLFSSCDEKTHPVRATVLCRLARVRADGISCNAHGL